MREINPLKKSTKEDNVVQLKPKEPKGGVLSSLFGGVMGKVFPVFSEKMSEIRNSSLPAAKQVKKLFSTTSDQVLEKAEETRRAVKLRMAYLEIEHHLNRLYPQIGKLVSDLSREGKKNILSDPDIKSRIHLAGEYLDRLEKLKSSPDQSEKGKKKD